ncbi:hypothetical protein J6590_058860 [Homalodisca vitripennis]|nr:hypothetical protein J6590_058860 [Homalodisca vitripennis]
MNEGPGSSLISTDPHTHERKDLGPARYRFYPIKYNMTWLLLGQVTAERSCPCKRPACPAIGGGSGSAFKPLVPRLSVREELLSLTSPVYLKFTFLFLVHVLISDAVLDLNPEI